MEKEMATLASGCFWCTEAIFQRLKGILSVVSGYSGGDPSVDGDNPSYHVVTSGNTGHAEAIQITFDPHIISYEKMLQIFFATHDPTTKDQQGDDIGSQYRSVIFYHSDEQKEIANRLIEELTKTNKYRDPIVTEVTPFEHFYKAEEYHQNYYNANREKNMYCQIIIDPKIQKLLKEFKKDIKEI